MRSSRLTAAAEARAEPVGVAVDMAVVGVVGVRRVESVGLELRLGLGLVAGLAAEGALWVRGRSRARRRGIMVVTLVVMVERKVGCVVGMRPSSASSRLSHTSSLEV